MHESDRHRPLYHFSPDNWMNDPIPFFWKDACHIFFQYNPNGAFWGTMHWGHVVSKDGGISWELLPVAIAPTPDSYDQDGIFTGCVVEHAGTFYAFYTGIRNLAPLEQTQCLATSTDLIHWQKHPANPLIPQRPEELLGECFRDPQVWCEGEDWYMVVGSEKADSSGGVALLYHSQDLLHWNYLHALCTGETEVTGHDFECPDFFPLSLPDEDQLSVLITSRGKTFWQTGVTEDSFFIPLNRGIVDGGAYYAAKTLIRDDGQRLLFGWIQETRPDSEQREAGWSGVLALPRLLSLLPDGALGMEPAPELTLLRGQELPIPLHTVIPENASLLEIAGETVEFLLDFQTTEAKRYGVLLRCTPDGTEGVRITYNAEQKILNDTPLELEPGETLSLHIFVDRSVIEVFANRRACLTLRTYPERWDCLHTLLFAEDTDCSVRGSAFTLRPLSEAERKEEPE